MPSQTSRFTRTTARSRGVDAPSLVTNAALAALLAVAVTLGLCMAVALMGWFFADDGGHGNTLDALRVGGVAWVLGLGGSAETTVGHVGLTPLGLTAIEVLAVVRCAHWGWRRSDAPESASLRALGMAWIVFILTFVIMAVAILAIITPPSVSPSAAGTLGGALLISTIPSAWAGLSDSGLLAEFWRDLPVPVRAGIRLAAQALFGLVAAAALLVAISLLVSFGNARETYSTLGLGFGDAIMLTVVCALALPNAVGLATAYLVGPGFAVGTHTSVTATSVSLGQLPLFPIVAALPNPGSQPGWYAMLLFAPGLCALVAAARIQREFADDEDDGWDQVLLRGLGGGGLAGLVVTVFASISGGALGDHRMSQIGAAFWPVLVCAVAGMALGGALGGLAMAAWQRWRA